VRIDLSYLPALGAAFLLVFARTGTMLMLLPGLGEQNISTRMRLTFALVLAAMLLPLHRDAYHIDPGALAPTLVMLVEEILIGAMLGVTGRLTFSSLEVAGSVIAQQLGLGFVTAVDPTRGEQGAIVGNFLTMLGITLFFATDMHHLVIAALNQRQLQSVRAGRDARFRRRSGADYSGQSPAPSASASNSPPRFSSLDCCPISGSACWRG